MVGWAGSGVGWVRGGRLIYLCTAVAEIGACEAGSNGPLMRGLKAILGVRRIVAYCGNVAHPKLGFYPSECTVEYNSW